jgi:hypothetical protein
MHVLINCDTTQATAANRGAIYVNGVKVTTFNFETYPSQNADTDFNTTYAHDIGRQSTGAYYCDFMLADVHWIDGQALDPTSFGEFSATTGVWMPKAYSGGSYGTNGFHLDFSNNASAAALGTDSSGAGNTWTVNNLSVTAGAGNDSLVDVPTNGSEVDTGLGNQVRGNYAVLNPLRKAGSHTLSNGNLDIVMGSDSGSRTTFATIGVSSGKWYWETTITTATNVYYPGVGVNTNLALSPEAQSGDTASGFMYLINGQKYSNGALSSYGASFSNGDVIGIALDMDAGTITFYKNGSTQGQAFTGITGTATPCVIGFGPGAAPALTVNYGARSFAYQAPAGFKSLNTASLPASVVTKPSTVMDVKLYTGNGTSQTISGLGFSPDLVWTKSRSAFDRHNVFDILRSGLRLRTDGTEAEDSTTVALTSNGFSLGSQSENNSNGQSYVAWTWDAGSSTVTNTQGSITSSVRTNNYLSIVTYTGTGANATVGHGLGVAPQMIIVKSRGSVTNWGVGHTSIGWANALRLNTTDASSAQATFWNSTAPTSTVFSVGTGPSTNNNGDSIVAYCFAPVAGYSSFGSYVGTGAVSTGPFCYTGFRPRLIILKAAVGGTSGWIMVDTARNTYNAVDYFLQANSSGAESTQVILDSLSNGFVIRPVGDAMNNSGVTFVWAAFAESPFQYARAR